MNYIGNVVCAIIEADGHFLIAQRPAGHPLERKWEFPGGKIANGESPQEAIKREIFEELNVVVEVNSALAPNSHAYNYLSLTLIPFRCSLIEGTPEPLEHSNIAWVNEETVKAYQFAEADIPILGEYLSKRGKGVA
ncbi:MAG: (deoxy)nucleoside triphosphate pyrophosphohydrolase [Proteobacteria bacterium]|nr:(deoxy)nucleoside triphosphate pyrophosphohydrolase [Pseudomonadota bacterium]